MMPVRRLAAVKVWLPVVNVVGVPAPYIYIVPKALGVFVAALVRALLNTKSIPAAFSILEYVIFVEETI